MIEAAVPFPQPTDDAIVVATVEAAITSKPRLAVFDHITSGTAPALPWSIICVFRWLSLLENDS